MDRLEITEQAAAALAAQLTIEDHRIRSARVVQQTLYGVAGCLALVFVLCALVLAL